MKLFKENKLLILSIFLSVVIHFGIFMLFSVLEEKEKTKKEEKPVIISFVETKNKSEISSTKRKIPRKTKVKTPKKSTKPPLKKSSKKNHKKTVKKSSKIKKETKKIEKQNEEKLIKKEKPKTQKPEKTKEKLQKEPVNKTKEIKQEVPVKEEGKSLKIASEKTKTEKNKKLPELPVSPPENKKGKEEKPPKQINISHLKGKDEIFQIGNEDKHEEKSPKKDKDIMKYLYGVRDKLQENLAYPLMAKRLEIEGTVIVRFVINPDGSVDENSIKVVKSSGSNILDKQAIITVENSIPFEPTPNKKKIVVEIPVIFEIIRSYD